MNKIFNKFEKGEFGYAKFNKTKTAVITIILFALAIGLYITGYVTTGSNKNLLTVVAVLGMLPASKSAVALIMTMRVNASDEVFKKEIDEHKGSLFVMYDMYFTSYDKNFYINNMVITSDSMICFTDDPKFDEKKFNEHINKHISLEGLKDIFIKAFTDKSAYLRRLDEINNSSADKNANNNLVKLLKNISI